MGTSRSAGHAAQTGRLLIVHDLHVHRPLNGPAKAKAVSIIDPNTELSFSLTLKRLQPVARWRAQEFKGLGLDSCISRYRVARLVVPSEGMDTREFKGLSSEYSENRGTIGEV